MASFAYFSRASKTPNSVTAGVLPALIILVACMALPGSAQLVLKPPAEGEPINLLPTDMSVLESAEARKDLPCSVTQRKPDLGFDLRFHSGYDVTVPLREVSGDGGLLTVIFRIYPEGDKDRASYFTQHIRVPTVDDEAKGDAALAGSIDLGPGKYHVDWLMRDRLERVCSSSWELEAALPAKDKPEMLFIQPDEIAQSAPEPFFNDSNAASPPPSNPQDALNVKLLVNFAPQNSESASLQRSDTKRWLAFSNSSSAILMSAASPSSLSISAKNGSSTARTQPKPSTSPPSARRCKP